MSNPGQAPQRDELLRDLELVKRVQTLARAAELLAQDPASAKLRKAWRAASDAAWSLCPETAPPADDSALRTLKAVADHLIAAGYKVAVSTVYEHAKRGLLRPDAQGRYPLAVVERYAVDNLRRRGDSGQDVEEDLRRKIAADADRAEHNARIAAVKAAEAEGMVVPRSQLDQELAARAAIFRADLLNLARGCPKDVLFIVRGDPERAPDLIRHMQEQVEAILDRYSHGDAIAIEQPLGDD